MKKKFRVYLFSILGVGISWMGCKPAIPLKAAQVAKTSVETTITTISSGTVDAERQAVLGFSAPGRVQKIVVRIGDHVSAGQILAQLENIDLQTIAQDAAREQARAKELFNSGLVSRVALDDANRALEVSRANLDKTIIRAPFAGIVTELNLQMGELASSAVTPGGKSPIRLIDLKPRIVKGDIDEVDLGKVKKGAPARIRILAVRSQPFVAQVSRVVPFVSASKEQDRTSQIELKILEDDPRIPVGASADVEIIVDKKEDVAAVPARLVLGTGDQRYLYKWVDGRAVKTPVTLGLGNYDRAEIRSGVAVGDIVLFPSDEVELKDGVKVGANVIKWP